MEKYFKSKKDSDKEIFDKFDKLVQRLSKGFWKNRISDVLTENFGYSISIFGETDYFFSKMVLVELDTISSVLCVRFKVNLDNQKALGLFKAKSLRQNNYVMLNFDQFTEETEMELDHLIKNYFKKGSGVLKDIIL